MAGPLILNTTDANSALGDLMSIKDRNTYRELCSCYNRIHDIDGSIFSELRQLIGYERDQRKGPTALTSRAAAKARGCEGRLTELQKERKGLLDQAKEIHANL